MSVRHAFYQLTLLAATIGLAPSTLCAQPRLGWDGALSASTDSPADGRTKGIDGPISMARLAERSGKGNDAAQMYLTLIEKYPDHPTPYHRLGVMAAQDKKWRVAEQYLNKAYSLAPPSTELLSDMGYLYYLQDRHQEAENILRQALALDPNDRTVNNNLGLVLGEQERFDESHRAFQRAGTPAEARANLAFVLSQKGQYEQALESYSQALSLDSRLRPAAMAMLQLAKFQPKPSPKEPTRPHQANNRSPEPSQQNYEAVAVAAQAAVNREDPPPTLPTVPDIAAPIVASRVDDGQRHGARPIADEKVAAASWQPELVTPKLPQLPQKVDVQGAASRPKPKNSGRSTPAQAPKVATSRKPAKAELSLSGSNPLRANSAARKHTKLAEAEPPKLPARRSPRPRRQMTKVPDRESVLDEIPLSPATPTLNRSELSPSAAGEFVREEIPAAVQPQKLASAMLQPAPSRQPIAKKREAALPTLSAKSPTPSVASTKRPPVLTSMFEPIASFPAGEFVREEPTFPTARNAAKAQISSEPAENQSARTSGGDFVW